MSAALPLNAEIASSLIFNYGLSFPSYGHSVLIKKDNDYHSNAYDTPD
jgi:hypothetical protein